MRKVLLLVIALGSSLVHAQEPMRGQIKMEFGWVKQADGSKKSVKGMVLNYTARPIRVVPFTPVAGAERLNAFQKLARGAHNPFQGLTAGRPGPLAADVQVYGNEPPIEGGINNPEEFVDPSSLDDVTLSGAGVNKNWKKLRFSVHVQSATSHQILIRWRIYDTENNQAPHQTDYTDEIADVGGTFTPISPSIADTWIYEVPDISSFGIVVPDGQCYFAQQLRSTSDLVNGEGPFEIDYYNVYNKDAMPSPGSSTDGWIFDSDPLDGNYESGVNPGEFDLFATSPPPFANMIYSVWVSTTSQQNLLQPNVLTRIKGVQPFGNVSGFVFEDDNNTYRIIGERASPSTSAVELNLESASPTTAITSYKISIVTKVKGTNVRQRLEAFHYATNSWKELDSRLMPNDQFVSISKLYGGTAALSGFVGPSNKVKARLRYSPFLATPTKMIVTADYLNWFVTR